MMQKSVLLSMNSSKSAIFSLGKYLFYCFLFFLCASTKILGSFSPCFYGLFLTFCFLGENCFYLSLSYIIGCFLHNVNFQIIFFSVFLCLGSFIVVFLHKKLNKIMKNTACFIYSFLFGLVYIYINFTNLVGFYRSVINVLLNGIFMLCSINFFRVLKARKFNFSLNIDEIFYGCVVLGLIFCGLQNLNSGIFDIVKLFGTLIVLFSSSILKNSSSIFLSVVMGLGVGLCAGDLNYITLFAIMSIFTYVFKNFSKIYASLMVVLIDLLFCLFLKNELVFNSIMILPTLISGFVYVIFPNIFILKLKDIFNIEDENSSLKNILNQNKLQISKKLMYTAEVFYEMDKNFRKLVKGNLDINNAKTMVCEEIIRSNCEKCSQKDKCLKVFSEQITAVFENLVNVGFEKGKITLVDLPAYLTNRCVMLNQVVNCVNSLLEEYKNYTKSLGDLDSSKILIAEQLSGISHILVNLSNETKENVNMDYKTEKLIKEALIYNNIIPSEVVCFEKDEKTNVISMIIRNIDFDNDKIVSILSQICSTKMVLEDVLPGNDTGLSYVSYKTAPTYDVAIGVASAIKGGQDVCGDNYSAIKLFNDKFMFALCDGMGHGEKANKASELSISMIENFYKAGYDNQTILKSVNKLLNLGSEEVFSALDVSVIDLKNGEVDFIKQGATIGFIKTGCEINRVESNSLPLGILKEVTPKVTKTILSPDDIIIMLSAGIVDSFGEEDLTNFLKSLNKTNPQEIADYILKKSMQNQKNYPKDDMTVLVGKLFYNTF